MYHFIYPSKDSYIYELNLNSEKNFGGDTGLVLKKEFDGDTLKGVSRVLLQFDLTELSQSLVSGEITTSIDGNGVPPRYYLRLYEQKTSELSPEYSLATFPLSQSWEDGTGYTTQDPNSRDGVSWERSDESFDNTKWFNYLGDDIILNDNNKSMDVSIGNWAKYGSGALIEAWDGTQGNGGDNGGLEVNPNANSGDQGVLLANDPPSPEQSDWMTPLISGRTYRVTADIKGPAADLTDYFFQIGGVKSSTFTVTTGWATYYKDIVAASNAPLIIGHENENGTNFYIDNISVKEGFPGGVWITGNAECSQSFSYESPDVNMDVTDMVNNWLDGTTPNNGLILKWSGSQEDSSDYSGDINFFSSNANSIYSPKLEVRWDAAYTGSQKSDFLITDGTKDNYLYMIDLRDEYRETETPKFRVGGGERYQTKVVTSTCDHLEVMLRSEAGGDDYWYSIDNYIGTLEWETNPENATYECGTDFSVTDINGLSRMRAACADGRYVTMCFAGDPASGACDHGWNDWTFLNGNNACSTTDLPNPLIPHNRGWYSIVDVATGETLIPFSDYSKLSMDWPVYKSSYFKLNLNGFITNRLYRIILRLQLDDGRYRIFDNNFDFKVIK